MANDIIDINVSETVETVAITVNPNLTTVNINQVTGGGVGTTNLSTTQTASNFTINSDTGEDAVVPLGNGTNAGASLNNYTTAEQTKLSGIATGAEVNVNADWLAVSGDAQILNKPTISGTNTGDQNLQTVTNGVGNNTTNNSITANSFIKSGYTGTNILLDDGNVVALSSVGGNTNLAPSQTASNFTINSDTGNDATIPLGNGTLAGATLNNYTTAEKTKLSGIATGATANSSDAMLLARGNHTGTQTASTISDIQSTITNNTSVLANTAKISFDSASSTKLGRYPSTATNGKILQGDGTNYVEINTPTGTTNLNYTPSATDGTVTSSTGSPATIPLANGTNAGLMTAAEKTKLTNTSGSNNGDETTATIKTKLSITTLSGSNTGDQDLSSLAPKASPTFTGTITTPDIIVSNATASTIAHFDAAKNIESLPLATYPSLTEVSYVKGVTSAIQTQLNNKIAKLVVGAYTTNTITTVSVAEYNAIVTKDANTLYFII